MLDDRVWAYLPTIPTLSRSFVLYILYPKTPRYLYIACFEIFICFRIIIYRITQRYKTSLESIANYLMLWSAAMVICKRRSDQLAVSHMCIFEVLQSSEITTRDTSNAEALL